MLPDAPSFSSDDVITGAAQGRLCTIIERIERLEEDKAAVSNDLKEVYAEAKGEGFDVNILRKVVRIRKQDKAKLAEEEALTDLYMSAIEGDDGRRSNSNPSPTFVRAMEKTLEQSFTEAVDQKLDTGDARGAVGVKMVEQYCIMAREYLSTLNRPFTEQDLETRFHWTRVIAKDVVGLLETAGLVSLPDAHGNRRHATQAEIKEAYDVQLYAAAVAAVRQEKNTSTSFIQRKFQLGYNKAASLMERMQVDGVVSEPDKSGKRTILQVSA